jgi:protein involved in sex pheromone biosynthesis
MLKKFLILLLMAALLWLSGCATTGVSDRSAAFGTCTSMMDARYCGP